MSLARNPADHVMPKTDDSLARANTGGALASGLRQASAVLQLTNGLPSPWSLPALNNAFAGYGDEAAMRPRSPAAAKTNTGNQREPGKQNPETPQEVLLPPS